MCRNGVGIPTARAPAIDVAVAGITRRIDVLCLTGATTTPMIATIATVSVWCGRRNSREVKGGKMPPSCVFRFYYLPILFLTKAPDVTCVLS